ncbi:hypothetical protein C7H19_10895 [Aphanothece hegewaldii CCALA 016]|uniref:Uncharacterized protein n=1 Tax=Aphanothece hegewaldii CCALA 016 TaxID=2107694 RepID=A0A2T1LXV3_9CHRO|nr:hypothetical protein [Aphanothece hegewaldii]PSF37220.1 hypothetical protein C7H19_10895 [Aphanothece hegewaldii CCALA 016]
MGIPFSQYDYQIFVFAYLTVQERKIWFNLEYYMAMFIYMRIDEKLGWKCMLVEDAQRLLAKN